MSKEPEWIEKMKILESVFPKSTPILHAEDLLRSMKKLVHDPKSYEVVEGHILFKKGESVLKVDGIPPETLCGYKLYHVEEGTRIKWV